MMFAYSLMLTLGLALASPWWGWRMVRDGRYRAGLNERLGRVPRATAQAVSGRDVIWVHAVSVGEVLAVLRLVAELRQALPGWVVAISTTTATGQKIARERFPDCPVFFSPLDFGFAVRAWMRALQPKLLVLVEGELWPRVLWECERAGVPVVVVNARVSDRSYRRTRRVRGLWLLMAKRVRTFLAQSEETAARLRELGAERVQLSGNLKYDIEAGTPTAMAANVRRMAGGTALLVAGSTLPGEEALLLQAWDEMTRRGQISTLLLAPRHPARFREVEALLAKRKVDTQMALVSEGDFNAWEQGGGGVILLDTLGDLGEVYAAADAAFLGGSLVPKGGHNPLEAAHFGVPVVMGPSYENFREIVDGMRAADAIRIANAPGLADALLDALRNGRAMGERGRVFFEAQAGATARTVAALLRILKEQPHA